ncbi:MAG TPA: hypothetical protein VF440_14575 [Novosphingobium sp.]
MTVHDSRTFKSGNSVAVRLPKGFAIPANTEVQLEKSGGTVTIRLKQDPAEAKARLSKMLDALAAIGPVGEIEHREPIVFPERPGLY